MSLERFGPNYEIEEVFIPTLPRVSKDSVHAVGGEFADQAEFISEIYWRLVTEQPDLTDQMSKYIGFAAKSPQEALRMKETFVLTYALLESQAKSDNLAETFKTDAEEPQPE